METRPCGPPLRLCPQTLRLEPALKSRARGGAKGGTQIHIYFHSSGDQVIVNAEVKTDDSPRAGLFRETTAAALRDEQRS